MWFGGHSRAGTSPYANPSSCFAGESAKRTVCTGEGENSSSALGVCGIGLCGMEKELFALCLEKPPYQCR